MEKSLLQRVSEAVDPEDFYSDYFDGRVTEARNYPCPFPERHKAGQDKLPSFRVFDSGGTYCHGCGFKSSSPVGFFAAVKRVSVEKAVRLLYKRYVEKTVAPDLYEGPHRKLLANPLVLKKLEEMRGLTRKTVEQFRLGYDGRRLTIPIFNDDGMCVNIRRYDLFKDSGPKMVSLEKGMGKPRLFPLSSLQAKTIYVVEGELDAILGCQIGLNCITPSGGAKTWDDSWSKLLKSKHVFVVPDNDKPGRDGAKARALSISKEALSCRVVTLPVKKEGEDLTDWILKYGGNKEKMAELCEAEPEPVVEQKRRAFERPNVDIFAELEDGKRNKTEAGLVMRAELLWEELSKRGAFFKNAVGQLFYAGDGIEAMPVTAAFGPFMSFLAKMTPLVNQALSAGKFMLNYLNYKAYEESAFSKTGSWTMCDGGKVYVHAGSDRILRISNAKIEHIKNAVNKDRVLLDLPMRNMAVRGMPSPASLKGLGKLKELFMDNLAMREEDKYLLVCWLLSIFFRDYVRPKPVVRFLAKTASGKSTSSKLVSILLYGEELLSHSATTMAATYEMSSRHPLLILDNLETRNMTPALEDFLLVAATGSIKAKRMMSSDTGLVMLPVNSLVLTNGIEPFTKHELIDRTLEINLDMEKYANPRYQETKVFGALKEGREEIMEAVLYLISKYVLKRIEQGEITRIMKEFGRHGKERFNEYIAVMCIMLDAIWGFMPLDAYARPHDLVNNWLDNQTRAEHLQDEGTNEVLYFLSTLADRAQQLMGASLEIVKSENSDKRISIKCTTRELLSDFRVLAKTLGMRCPWQTEQQLGNRLWDSMDILNRAGWFRRQYESMGRRKYEYIFKGKLVKKERKKDRG